MKSLKPYGQHLLIKVLPVEQGILSMSGDDQEKPIRGEVLAIGDVQGVSIGDVVIYDYYTAVEYHQTDQELLIIHIDDILAIEE